MRKGLFALVASAVALWPAGADATTVTMGDPAVPTGITLTESCGPCTPGFMLAQAFTPDSQVNFAPASGLITSWRVSGEGALKLSVLESVEGGGWVAVATTAPATHTEDQPNATSLPIGFDDLIAVEVGPGENKSAVKSAQLVGENGQQLEWKPQLTPGGMAGEPGDIRSSWRLGLSADVVLAPVLSSLGPTSGSTAGGNAVEIAGKYLDGATSVTFGSTPASSFSVDSPNQITAIAPASVASTVDVRVTGPGGSSEVSTADRYTSTAPSLTTTGPLAGPAPKPTVTGFSESSSRWRRGRSLPHISSAAPVGTTFSFSLNEPASVNLTFSQRVPGRRVAGRCVAPSHRNAGRPRCKRALSVGSFALPGHAGLDKVGFQGRLSRSKTLKPGSYLVTVTARDARGLKVVSRSLGFTIVS